MLADLGGGHKITLGDLEERLNREPSVVRQQYATIAKRREYLVNWVQLEILADEARKQGFDKDPAVVEALKHQMIRRYLKEAVYDQIKAEHITDEDVKAYYDNNLQMYQRPAQVEVRHMLFADEAKAKKVHEELRAGSQNSAAQLNGMWKAYVARVSEDKSTVPYLGSLGRVSRVTPDHASPTEKARLAAIPAEVKEHAFLTEPYALSSVFKSSAGWHILMPISKLPAVDKKLEEVSRSIRGRLLKRKRDLQRKELIETLRKRSRIDVNDDAVRILPTPKRGPISKPGDKPRAPGKAGVVVKEVP